MYFQSLLALGLLSSSALAVPSNFKRDSSDPQPISGSKGAPLLGKLLEKDSILLGTNNNGT